MTKIGWRAQWRYIWRVKPTVLEVKRMPSVFRPWSNDFPSVCRRPRPCKPSKAALMMHGWKAVSGGSGVSAISASALPPRRGAGAQSRTMGHEQGVHVSRVAENRKALVPPFFDRLSPFLTVFPTTANRDSLGDSRFQPFSAPSPPSKNVENG